MAAEFILPLKVDIAAAKMPEINNPTIPTGNWVKYTTENSIAVRNTDTQILRIHLVIGIKRSAYKEEISVAGTVSIALVHTLFRASFIEEVVR